jgi:DNA primase
MNSLLTAAKKYARSLPDSPAVPFLESRGLDLEQVERFRLGYVAEPEIGHDTYRGRLSIPYWRRSASGVWSVRGMKFRSLQANPGSAKYLPNPGFKTMLFNTQDAILNEDWLCLTEGEFDCIAASSNGIPAVGVPGATTWQAKWNPIFYGYETLYVLADGDKAGLEMGEVVADNLPNAKVIPMLDGEDVNSMIQKYGADKIREMIGR